MKTEIENSIIELLYEKEYLGRLAQETNRVITRKIPTAGVTIENSDLVMYINPDYFLKLNEKERVGLIEHEMNHILNGHLTKLNYTEDPKRLNRAMDKAINQYIANLPQGALYPSEGEEKFREYVYYYETNKGDGNTLDDHSMWKHIDSTTGEIVVQRAVKSALGKMSGNLPQNIELLVNKLLNTTVDWRRVLKKYISNSTKEIDINTKMKRNRRYGLTLPGWRRESQLNIYVAVDVSGSVSDEFINRFFTEIDSIISNAGVIEVFEVDMNINKRYNYVKNKQINVTGRGGTDYNVFFDEIQDETPDLIIYFGDGESPEVVKKPSCPVIWALMPGCSIPAKFGKKVEVKL